MQCHTYAFEVPILFLYDGTTSSVPARNSTRSPPHHTPPRHRNHSASAANSTPAPPGNDPPSSWNLPSGSYHHRAAPAAAALPTTPLLAEGTSPEGATAEKLQSPQPAVLPHTSSHQLSQSDPIRQLAPAAPGLPLPALEHLNLAPLNFPPAGAALEDTHVRSPCQPPSSYLDVSGILTVDTGNTVAYLSPPTSPNTAAYLSPPSSPTPSLPPSTSLETTLPPPSFCPPFLDIANEPDLLLPVPSPPTFNKVLDWEVDLQPTPLEISRKQQPHHSMPYLRRSARLRNSTDPPTSALGRAIRVKNRQASGQKSTKAASSELGSVSIPTTLEATLAEIVHNSGFLFNDEDLDESCTLRELLSRILKASSGEPGTSINA